MESKRRCTRWFPLFPMAFSNRMFHSVSQVKSLEFVKQLISWKATMCLWKWSYDCRSWKMWTLTKQLRLLGQVLPIETPTWIQLSKCSCLSNGLKGVICSSRERSPYWVPRLEVGVAERLVSITRLSRLPSFDDGVFPLQPKMLLGISVLLPCLSLAKWQWDVYNCMSSGCLRNNIWRTQCHLHPSLGSWYLWIH